MTIPRSEAVVHEEVAGSPSALSNTGSQTSVSRINVPALNGVTEEHDDPHRLARIQLANGATRAGVWTLRYWQGSFWQWKAGCYRAVGDDDLRVALTGTIKVEFDRLARLHGGKSKRVAAGTIGNVVMALKSLALVGEVEAFPAWLGPAGAGSNYFAFENGLLNSAVGCGDGDCLEPATPEWFSPVKFPFNYDEDATCPQWRTFVASIFAPDPRGADLLQEIMGYLLVPDTSMQKFFILEGSGGNGKGVVTKIITAMVGKENVSNVAIEQFAERFALASTIGKLANIVHELDRPRDLAEGTLKSFVAGDRMTIDRKHRSPVEVAPTARLLITTNEWPTFRDKSNGIMRRLVPLRFPVQFSEAQMDHALPDRLMGELPGIFNWAFVGLGRLRQQGEFSLPESSKALFGELRPAGDTTDAFLLEHCLADAGSFAVTDDLFRAYQLWAREGTGAEVGASQFAQALRRNYPAATHRREGGGERRYGYEGVRLKASGPSGQTSNVLPFTLGPDDLEVATAA